MRVTAWEVTVDMIMSWLVRAQPVIFTLAAKNEPKNAILKKIDLFVEIPTLDRYKLRWCVLYSYRESLDSIAQ